MNLFQALEWMVAHPMCEMVDSQGDFWQFNKNGDDPQIEVRDARHGNFVAANPFLSFILPLTFEPATRAR